MFTCAGQTDRQTERREWRTFGDDIQLFPLLRNLTLVAGINCQAALLITAIIWRNRHKSICIINGDLILTRRGSLYSRVAAFSVFSAGAFIAGDTCCVVSDIDADFMSRTTMNKFLFAAA